MAGNMAQKRIDSYSGPEAFTMAKRKAKFGHQDWIAWVGKDGIHQARRVSRSSVKECLLATGTAGRWYLYCASDGIGMIGWWWLGINIINQFKCGFR
jgi:hypothetical protein